MKKAMFIALSLIVFRLSTGEEYSLKEGDQVELPEHDIRVRRLLELKKLKQLTPATEQFAKPEEPTRVVEEPNVDVSEAENSPKKGKK